MKKLKRNEFTDEFSFMLKPSEYGIGIFATHDIKKGVYLRLFGNENKGKKLVDKSVLRNNKEVPKMLREHYCINRGKKSICPADFGQMPIGWYINHSSTPTAVHRNYHYYASHNISSGEEITANYNCWEEPEGAKDDYYKI